MGKRAEQRNKGIHARRMERHGERERERERERDRTNVHLRGSRKIKASNFLGIPRRIYSFLYFSSLLRSYYADVRERESKDRVFILESRDAKSSCKSELQRSTGPTSVRSGNHGESFNYTCHFLGSERISSRFTPLFPPPARVDLSVFFRVPSDYTRHVTSQSWPRLSETPVSPVWWFCCGSRLWLRWSSRKFAKWWILWIFKIVRIVGLEWKK